MQYSRDELEKLACARSSAGDHYDLADNLDALSDAELRILAGVDEDAYFAVLEDFGVVVKLLDKALFEMPLTSDGTFDLTDHDAWSEVSNVENPEFLQLVNENFGTEFTPDDF